MAVELLGANGMTVEMKQYYDRRLLSKADKDTVFMNYGLKRPIPPRGGKSIEFRRFEKLTMTAGASYTLTEGTAPTETQATVSNVVATISQYGQYIKVSDILETQGFDPVIAELTDVCGIAMKECLDIVVRDTLSNATTLQYADDATVIGTSGAGAVGSGNYLDAAELREMRRTLRRNGARTINGKYLCFIHPDNTMNLFEDADIRDTFQYAGPRDSNNPLISGVIGEWEGWRFVETNNLRIRASYGMAGADIYEGICMGDEFYGITPLSAHSAKMIIHPRGTGGHTDPLEQYSTVGWKAALAAVILNNDFGGIIYCASSRSNSA